MNASALTELDFTRYARILHAALPGAAGWAVWDGAGRLVWADTTASTPEPMPAGVAGLPDGEPVWLPDSAAPGVGLWCVNLGEHALLGHVGGLGVYVAADRALAPDSAAPPNQTIATLAACLRREFDLVDELNTMAGELANRYEELNLVYHTGDQVNDTGQGRQVLQELVLNCAEAMNVDLTLLLLPDSGISLTGNGPRASRLDADLVLDYLECSLLPWMSTKAESVAINHKDDAARLDSALAPPCRLLASPILDDSGRAIGLLASANPPQSAEFHNSDRNLLEVMARKVAKVTQASFDSLTGLIKRAGFENHLRAALRAASQHGRNYCLLHLDIDKLEVVNENLGREAGDALIRHVAGVLQSQLRGADILARLAGDEYGILLDMCSAPQGEVVARKLSRAVRQHPFVWRGQTSEVSISMGIVTLDQGSLSVADALSNAQLACAAARELGRDQIHVAAYGGEENVAARRSLINWVGKVQAALREDRFQLYGQLIQPVTLNAGDAHVEILIRMRDDQGGVLPPGLFLPAAERYALMPNLDRWVIQRALDMLSHQWRRAGSLDAVYCVNLSGQSLTDPTLLEFISGQLRRMPFPATSICFEITETAAIARMDQAREFIAHLKRLGCTFALDDFGSGLSSYAYLKTLAVDFVKIDGGFVKDILENPVSDAMVRSISHIARLMGLKSIAEFVENDAIHQRLAAIGVDFVQGYGIAKPVPLEQMLARESTAHEGWIARSA